jgi:hypothetical protein
MNRNLVFFLIGGLAVAVVVLGYRYYQERQTTGIEINVGETGISIQQK